MRIVYLTAGAGGNYCGSCLRDNTLVRHLRQLGHQALLQPLYTPIRTDTRDCSEPRVFYGGINVYLQQRAPWLARVPRFLDGWLNGRSVLQRMIGDPSGMDPHLNGKMALSLLAGEHGPQRKELHRLLSWLQSDGDEHRPDLIHLTNILIAGCVPRLKQTLDIPVVVSLQGDDLFLNSLPRSYRQRVTDRLQDLVPHIDHFTVYSTYYADKMAQLLRIPREKIAQVPLGIDLDDWPAPSASMPTGVPETHPPRPSPPTIGYLARISPHKGFHLLVDAFLQLRQHRDLAATRLHVAGWLSREDQSYYDAQMAKIDDAGARPFYHHAGSLDLAGKQSFFRQIDAFSVPSIYGESKGLSILEAMASGTPCVQPANGIYPELLAKTGGGLLCRPNDAGNLASTLTEILTDDTKRSQLSRAALKSRSLHLCATHMAIATVNVYRSTIQAFNAPTGFLTKHA